MSRQKPRPGHDPGLDPGREPVSRLREALSYGRTDASAGRSEKNMRSQKPAAVRRDPDYMTCVISKTR
jgi:hypothetical protein